MGFKVVATPFRQQANPNYQHELEALQPIGAEITIVTAASDEEWLAQARDADAIIAGGAPPHGRDSQSTREVQGNRQRWGWNRHHRPRRRDREGYSGL